MDGRCALNKGTKLALRNSEGGLVSYVIRKEIGCGGSCIVKDGSYTDDHGNPKLVRIKYVCPKCGAIIRATKLVNVVCGAATRTSGSHARRAKPAGCSGVFRDKYHSQGGGNVV